MNMMEICTLSSSSSSSDEEVLMPIQRRRFRDRGNPFDIYDESEFKKRFRLSKELVINLLCDIGPHIEPSTKRSMPLSAMNQLLLCLRFYASGSSQLVIGEPFNVNKSTACRIIKRVTHYIALLRPRCVRMPGTEEGIANNKAQFLNIAGFPDVLGCVDGTHVPIQSPGGDYAEIYRNKKGNFSLNVQVVCNAKLEICDIVCRWQGSTPDNTVFNSSRICARIERGELGGGHLLGDSAYTCRKFLMTPIDSPGTAGEIQYNVCHTETLSCIYKTVQLWKKRFPCLFVGMKTKLETTLAVVVATAVLHNMAVNKETEQPIDCEASDQPIDTDCSVAVLDDDCEGNAARMEIVNKYFS